MKILLILLVLLAFSTQAQVPENINLPKGYTRVLTAKGDLDKDGIAEVIVAYNTSKATEKTGFKRELWIYKSIEGVLKVWKKNTTVLWDSQDCGFCTDNGIDLSIQIKNNTFIVKQTFWHSTRHTSEFKNVFRFQNNDWYLIGSTYKDRYNCGYQHTYDINFSTRQVQVDYDDEDCEDDPKPFKPSQERFKYPFKAIPKMDGFTAGKVELKIPGSKLFFYY